MDYINNCVDWRERKLEILRDLIGNPAVKNAKKGPDQKLVGGIRWTTNLIQVDPNNPARFSSLDRMVPDRWKFSFFLERLVHKDDAMRVRLDCVDTFPGFNGFAAKSSEQMNKDFTKQSRSLGSSAKKKKTDDGAYSPPGGRAGSQPQRRKGTPRSAKGKREKDYQSDSSDSEDEDIEEDLEESDSEDEDRVDVAVSTDKVSVSAVTNQLRAIGSSKCTLPFEEQLNAIRWLTENSFMTVTIKPDFKNFLDSPRKPIPLTDFPGEISTFVDAAFQATVLAKEEEEKENTDLRTNTIQKQARASRDLGSEDQRDMERMEQLVKTRPVVRIPRKPKHQDSDSRVSKSTSGTGESLANNLKETPDRPAATAEDIAVSENKCSEDVGSRTEEAAPETGKSPPKRPEEAPQMSDDEGDRQAQKRKRGSDVEDGAIQAGSEVAASPKPLGWDYRAAELEREKEAEEKREQDSGAKVSDEKADSAVKRGKLGAQTRSGRGGGRCSDEASTKKRKDDKDEHDDDKDGADSSGGDRTMDRREAESNSGGTTTSAKEKGSSKAADPAAKSGNKSNKKKARLAHRTAGKYFGMPESDQSDESEFDPTDSDDDSIATVNTGFIYAIPVVSPVATPIVGLYNFDEEYGIKEVLDFEQEIDDYNMEVAALQIPDDLDGTYHF